MSSFLLTPGSMPFHDLAKADADTSARASTTGRTACFISLPTGPTPISFLEPRATGLLRVVPVRWLLIALALVPAVAQAYDFVGPESCKACHPEAYLAWKQSKHARAKDSLSPTQQKDARCTSCHSPSEEDQTIAGISCENCHGGGQYYATNY